MPSLVQRFTKAREEGGLADFVKSEAETMLVVEMPKTASVENFGLGIMLLILRGLAVFWIIYLAYHNDPWYQQAVPSNTMAFWAGATEDTYFEEQVADDGNRFCNTDHSNRQESNWIYQYQYDSTNDFNYTDIGCSDLPADERFIKGEQEMYIPLFFKEKHVTTSAVEAADRSQCNAACAGLLAGADGSTHTFTGVFKTVDEQRSCICEQSTATNHFVTGVHAVYLSLAHDMSVILPAPFGPPTHTTLSSTREQDNLLTMVRVAGSDPDEPHLHSIGPSTPIGDPTSFTVAQVLQFAGIDLTSDVLEGQPPNFLNDDSMNTDPLLRMTGFEIEVVLSYHNSRDRGHGRGNGHDHPGPVCFIEFVPKKNWAGKPVLHYKYPMFQDTFESEYRHRYYYGIRFTFHAQGHFSAFNVQGLFFFVATSLVYIQLPTTLVMLFAQYMLGNLSNIYTAATRSPLVINDLVKGLLCRSLMASYAFSAVRGDDDGGGVHSAQSPAPSSQAVEVGGVGIEATASRAVKSQGVMKLSHRGVEGDIHTHDIDDHIRSLFPGSTLDEGEFKMMRRLIMTGDDMDDSLGGEDQVSLGGMRLQDFVHNCTNNEVAKLKHLARMFNKEKRKRWILERLFDPRARKMKQYQKGNSNSDKRLGGGGLGIIHNILDSIRTTNAGSSKQDGSQKEDKVDAAAGDQNREERAEPGRGGTATNQSL